MENDFSYFSERRAKAKSQFTAQQSLYCPFFKTDIVLNADGFHHLQFSARRERNKREQLLKFSLLPLAFEIVRKSGTIQEYRKSLAPIGDKSSRGWSAMKEIEYWGLVAIVGEKLIKVRVVLRRVGTGNITFWSVMPYSKIIGGVQKKFFDGIEDE